MNTLEKYKLAVEKAMAGYDRLLKDLQKGVPPEELVDAHEDLHLAVSEEVEELTELKEPDILIEIIDGQVHAVHCGLSLMTYVVKDDRYRLDPHDVIDCESFTDYKELLDSLEPQEEEEEQEEEEIEEQTL